MTLDELRKHAAELRTSYVNAPPRSRARTARDRVEHIEGNPNRLVAYVSGIEGMARSLALNLAVKNGEEREEAYRRLWKSNAETLLTDHVGPLLGKSVQDLFGETNWELFCIAVDFRNLLVHEATYLRGGVSQDLLAATEHVFEVLQSACANRWRTDE